MAASGIIGTFQGVKSPGHGVRPAPPLHGRDRRRLPRLGHPEGRHRRHLERDRQCSAREWRGDPDGSAGRQNPDQGRARHRRRPRVRRGARGRLGPLLGRRAPHVHRPDGAGLDRRRVRGTRSAASSSAARRARSTWPSTRCRTSPPCPARASTSAARSRSRPSVDDMERAYDDAKYGRFSAKPYIDIIIPTLVDPSMAPPGKHVMSCFVQYAPYNLDPSLGGWDNQREAFGDAVVNRIAEFAPDLPSKILHPQRPDAARHRADDRPDRGQHLPGRALARAAVLQPARARLGALPDPDQATSGCAARRPTRAAGSWARTAASRRWSCSGRRAAEPLSRPERPAAGRWDAVVIGGGPQRARDRRVPREGRAADARPRAARARRRRGRHDASWRRASACRRSRTRSGGCGRRCRRTSGSRATGCRSSRRTCGSSRPRRTAPRSRSGRTSRKTAEGLRARSEHDADAYAAFDKRVRALGRFLDELGRSTPPDIKAPGLGDAISRAQARAELQGPRPRRLADRAARPADGRRGPRRRVVRDRCAASRARVARRALRRGRAVVGRDGGDAPRRRRGQRRRRGGRDGLREGRPGRARRRRSPRRRAAAGARSGPAPRSSRITSRDGRATGVVLADGEEIEARARRLRRRPEADARRPRRSGRARAVARLAGRQHPDARRRGQGQPRAQEAAGRSRRPAATRRSSAAGSSSRRASMPWSAPSTPPSTAAGASSRSSRRRSRRSPTRRSSRARRPARTS